MFSYIVANIQDIKVNKVVEIIQEEDNQKKKKVTLVDSKIAFEGVIGIKVVLYQVAD